MRRLSTWCCVVLMLLTGCGGAMTGAKSAPQSMEASAPAGAAGAPAADFAPQSAPPPSATAAESAAPSARSSGGDRVALEPAPSTPPRERPGLGTEWGETRSSHVHDVSFVRADDGRPFAVASLHYNDRAGVEALATYHAERAARFRDVSAAGGAISVSIRDESGEPLQALHVADRTYVMGNAGQRYSIVLTNHTGHRFEAVATVDGLDVINGRQGSLDQRGYVLMPFATLEIDGFRQSKDAVAAFRFAKVADSYAAQTGSARNVGVIGVAFFTERGDVVNVISEDELHTRDTASPFPGADPRFAQPPRR